MIGEKCSACSTGYNLFPACDKCATEFYGFPNCIGKENKNNIFFSNEMTHFAKKYTIFFQTANATWRDLLTMFVM